jgi:TolA-binding protein
VRPAPEPEPVREAPAAPPAPKVRAPHASRDAALAELNARYREAIAARRRGDVSSALKLFTDFYQQHPESQLAEAARVEALRLLGKSDPAAARAAAEEYLSIYPKGFARDEARAMLQP